MKRLTLGTILLAALAGILLLVWFTAPGEPSLERSTVSIGEVRIGALKRQVVAPGVLAPWQARWLAADSAARVEAILLAPGATVTASTLLMRLSNREIDDQVARARIKQNAERAALDAQRMAMRSESADQRALVRGLEAEREALKAQASAELKLQARGVISALQAERSTLALRQADIKLELERSREGNLRQHQAARLQSDQARLDEAQQTLKMLEQRAEALNVRAGLDGIVEQIVVEEGAQVSVGSNLARIAQIDRLKALLRVPQGLSGDVRVQQIAQVTIAGVAMAGTVTRVAPTIEDGAVGVEVQINGALPKGARVDLGIDGAIELERIARTLLLDRPTIAEPGSFVQLYRLDPSGARARRVMVGFGRASLTEIEVLSGLKVGDRVILSDLAGFNGALEIQVK